MWLQDVHSLLPSKIEERRLRPAENSPDSVENGALVHRYALIRVGNFNRHRGGDLIRMGLYPSTLPKPSHVENIYTSSGVVFLIPMIFKGISLKHDSCFRSLLASLAGSPDLPAGVVSDNHGWLSSRQCQRFEVSQFCIGGKEMRCRLPITVDNTPMTWQTMALPYMNLDDIVKVACEYCWCRTLASQYDSRLMSYTKVAVAKKFAGPQRPKILSSYGE